MSTAIFLFNGNQIKIQCSREDKMKDICIKLAIKIDKNINNLYFLYDGKMINLELKYKEIVNKIDNNEMKILVYEKEKEGLICPNCGGNIDINNIIIFNNNIKDKIKGLKDQLENIIYIMENIIEEIKKKNEEIKKKNEEINKNKLKDIILGIIDIEINDINKDIILYESKEEIDVYINEEKINIINNNDKKMYKFKKEGKYEYKLIYKNNITNLNSLFSDCSQLISLDLSNFDTSKVNDM